MASASLGGNRKVHISFDARQSEHSLPYQEHRLHALHRADFRRAPLRKGSMSSRNSQPHLQSFISLSDTHSPHLPCSQNPQRSLQAGQGFLTSKQGFLIQDSCQKLRPPSRFTRCQCINGQAVPPQPPEPSFEEPLSCLVHALEGDRDKATETAKQLIGRLNEVGREAVLSALFESASENIDDVFRTVDLNADGILSKEEFSQYVEAQAIELGKSKQPPTQRQLFLLSVRAAIGNVGFGFTDNVIMILAGDVIQNSIGTSLGLSTIMSAGLGNCIADVIGAAFKESIEGASGHFMPDPKASPFQLATKEAWWAETTGASVGIACGCILGLSPLFIMGRWRAVDDVEVVERSADVELVGKHASDSPENGAPGAASAVIGAGGGQSGPGGGLSRESVRGTIGNRVTDGSVLKMQGEYVTAVVEVPRRTVRVQGGFGEVWVIVAFGVLMCVRRLYDLRQRRG